MAEDRHLSARVEIRCSGSGGQGILLAAAIIAEAAAALGRYVVQTQSYGPEARGGASKSEVIVAGEPIDYPEVRQPDVSLVLSQAGVTTSTRPTRAWAACSSTTPAWSRWTLTT